MGTPLHSPGPVLALVLAMAFAGCQHATLDHRIREHAAEFNALDPAAQKKVRGGTVEPGYTASMVQMALGKPGTIEADAQGNPVWVYRREPVTAYNETIVAGHRRRQVYNPIKGSYDIVVEAIDTKAFPHLVPRITRVTLQKGRVVSVDTSPRG